MDLKYPIGTFQFEGQITKSMLEVWMKDLEDLPHQFEKALKDLDEEQLNTPYRDGGWTIRQVVHHVADSHMNAYIRFKLALTEEEPVIKPYEESAWAELVDYEMPVDISLNLIKSLHSRLVHLLQSLSSAEFDKMFIHPISGEITIGKNIGLYAWHGNHHLAHITNLRNRKGW